MKPLKITSYNVNGLKNPIKRKKILQQLKKDGGDIAFLQETHLNKSEHEKLGKLATAQVFYSSHKSSRRGVAILIWPQHAFQPEKVSSDKEGRYVMVTGKFDNIMVSLINVYNPPEEGPELVKKVVDMIASQSKGITIAAGDFNLIMDANLDFQGKRQHSSEPAARILRRATKEIGIVDVWRTLNPTEKDYTFHSKQYDIYSRLDYFFILKNEMSRVQHCNIHQITLSDHALISLIIEIGRGKCRMLWRLNNSLLLLKDFKTKIKTVIEEYVEINDTGEINALIIWEGLKAVTRGEIICFSSRKKKEREKKVENLELKIKDLEQAHKVGGAPSVLVELNKIRKELDGLLTERVQRAMAFTKQKYYDGGVKSLKILSYKLRKQQTKSSITCIKNNVMNKTLTDKQEIAEEFAEYYRQLYSPDKEDTQTQLKDYLQNLNLPQVADVQNQALTTPITMEEILKVIQGLKSDKSPGSDGFTGEFYREFKVQLTPILHKAFNWALSHGKWADTWCNSIITVIYKEGKDPTQCEGYRPITLLNIDQKLLSSILANRLAKVMPDIIDLDQTGFISNRQLSDNVRRTLNIIEHAQKNNKQALILTLDAEKAFDRVAWPFIFETCRSFGLSHIFISWLQAMYTISKAQVRVNGTLSCPFKLRRGTRQGDPLSPLIFALCIEPLAVSIRRNYEIEGIEIAGIQHKLALYADDIILYLTKLENTLPALMNNIKEYSTISGYKLNKQKCESISLGDPISIELKKKYPWKWDQAKIKYLGIEISKNMDQLYKLNYEKLETKIKQDLNRWSIVPLSLFGRIDTIRMNILPRFLFLFKALPIYVSPSMFTFWDRMLIKFVWDNKKPRVKMKTLKLAKRNGGLGLPNLQNYYYAAQIQTLQIWLNDDMQAKWRSIERSTSKMGKLLPLFGKKPNQKTDNKWFQNTLTAWNKVRRDLKINTELLALREIRDDPDFIPNKEGGIFNIWNQKGLRIFGQFIDNKGIVQFESLQKEYGLPHSHFF